MSDLYAYLPWLLAAISVAGNWFVIKGNVAGFWLWTLSNVGWIAIDIRAGVPAQATLFAVYLGLSLYGAWEWKRKG